MSGAFLPQPPTILLLLISVSTVAANTVFSIVISYEFRVVQNLSAWDKKGRSKLRRNARLGEILIKFIDTTQSIKSSNFVMYVFYNRRF